MYRTVYIATSGGVGFYAFDSRTHLSVVSALGLSDSPRRGRDDLYIWIWQPAALGSVYLHCYSLPWYPLELDIETRNVFGTI